MPSVMTNALHVPRVSHIAAFRHKRGILNKPTVWTNRKVTLKPKTCTLTEKYSVLRGGRYHQLSRLLRAEAGDVHELQQSLSSASCMDDVYDVLADRLLTLYLDCPSTQYLIGVAGGPGAGKSTLTQEVCARINRVHEQAAVVVPMDGFHLYKAQLDSMPNSEEAHRRRGAEWTFDAVGFVHAVKTLRGSGKASMPSFDHAVGDPVPDAITVCEDNRIILVEGNYLLLDVAPWNELRDIYDETWHITCNDLDVQMARVERRHMATGNSAELAAQRVNGNDRPNAELVEQHARHADVRITSIQI